MKRGWLWIGAAAVVLAFLYLPTLGVSAGQILVFLLVLLCPLLHLFGMHRHGGHGSAGSDGSGSSSPSGDQAKTSDREI
jgi:hypothetical protein